MPLWYVWESSVKGTRPTWMVEQVWISLLIYWDFEKFKQKSIQNKLNRSSTQGETLHSTGRKSHIDITLDCWVGMDWSFDIGISKSSNKN